MRLWLALVALALAWAALPLFSGLDFDRGLLMLLYAGPKPRFATALQVLSAMGGTPVLLAATAVGAVLLALWREWRSVVLLLAISLSGRLLVALQPDWIALLRPDARSDPVPVQSVAFPSDFAANATMVWLCLALLLPRVERSRDAAVWAAAWLAILVGTGQVMLGVVRPSAVIGGWAFGLLWTLLLLHLSGHRVNEGTPMPLTHSPWKGDCDDPGKQADRIRPRP